MITILVIFVVALVSMRVFGILWMKLVLALTSLAEKLGLKKKAAAPAPVAPTVVNNPLHQREVVTRRRTLKTVPNGTIIETAEEIIDRCQEVCR